MELSASEYFMSRNAVGKPVVISEKTAIYSENIRRSSKEDYNNVKANSLQQSSLHS
jgi:hypothetical protein